MEAGSYASTQVAQLSAALATADAAISTQMAAVRRASEALADAQQREERLDKQPAIAKAIFECERARQLADAWTEKHAKRSAKVDSLMKAAKIEQQAVVQTERVALDAAQRQLTAMEEARNNLQQEKDDVAMADALQRGEIDALAGIDVDDDTWAPSELRAAITASISI